MNSFLYFDEIFRAYYEDEVDVQKSSQKQGIVVKRNDYENYYTQNEKKFEEKMIKIHRAILKLVSDVIDISAE